MEYSQPVQVLALATICFCAAAEVTAQGPKLDRYGDPLPHGAVLRLGTTRLQTKGGFAWTPDGKSLVTTKHGVVFFWDMSDGHCRETMSVPTDPGYVSGLALSADGKKLVCTDRLGTIAVWDLNESKIVTHPASPERTERDNVAMALSPDGATIATIGGGWITEELQLWETATCTLRRKVKLPNLYSPTLAFAPDGKLIAVASSRDKSIVLVDATKAAEPVVIENTHGDGPNALAFTPDGKHLYSTGVAAIAGLPKDRPEWKPEILIWDVAQRRQVGELSLELELRDGCSLAFSPEGKTLVSVHPDQILVWDVSRRAVVQKIDGLRFWNASSTRVSIDPLGKYVAVDDDTHYVRLWELATGQPVFAERGLQGGIVAVSWSPDGKTFATGGFSSEKTCLWDATAGNLVRQLDQQVSFARGLQHSAKGAELVICGNESGRDYNDPYAVVRWHSATSGKLLREFRTPGRAWKFALSADESRAAVITSSGDVEDPRDTRVRIIDTATAKELRSTGTSFSYRMTLAWTADGGTLLIINGDKLLRLDTQTLQVVFQKVLPHEKRDLGPRTTVSSGIFGALFIHGGNEVVTYASLPELYGWSTLTGEKRWTMKVEGPHFRGMVVSPDESILAVIASLDDTNAKTLRLFDIVARRELAHYDLGREMCDPLAFSPDGSRILVGFYDGTALVYDVSEAVGKQ